MPEDQVIYRAPDKIEHAEMVYDLLPTYFGEGIDTACRNGRIAHSHLDWDVSQIGLIGDELVTYWGVYDLKMRIGRARVRTTGINLPITHPDYRGRGLMPETIKRSMVIAKKKGYGLSVINMTHAYFLRFGYVPAWPETNFVVKTNELPDATPNFRVEEVNAYDLMGRQDLADIYNANNETMTGTAVRPTYLRSKNPGKDFEPGYLFKDEQGKPVGYLLDGPPEPGQMYCHSDSAGDAEERLKVLGMLARRHGCESVNFHRLPFMSDLGVLVRRLNGQMRVHYRRDGGYLIQIIDLKTTLEAMVDELSRRLKRSYLFNWCGELLVRADEQKVTLLIEKSEVRVISASSTVHRVEGDQHIAQLLVGSYPPLETVRAGNISLDGDARDLVEALFPEQWPQMPNDDL